nr:MAG TPA: protein of unknown function (DUF3362) [Caudoviricetes sp.]
MTIPTPLRLASHFQKTGIRLETLEKVRIPKSLRDLYHTPNNA